MNLLDTVLNMADKANKTIKSKLTQAREEVTASARTLLNKPVNLSPKTQLAMDMLSGFSTGMTKATPGATYLNQKFNVSVPQPTTKQGKVSEFVGSMIPMAAIAGTAGTAIKSLPYVKNLQKAFEATKLAKTPILGTGLIGATRGLPYTAGYRMYSTMLNPKQTGKETLKGTAGDIAFDFATAGLPILGVVGKNKAAKEIAKDRLGNLLNYSTELIRRGYPKEAVEKIGVNEGMRILTKGITYKDYLKSQGIRAFKEEISTIVPDLTVKQKANVLSWFATPEKVFTRAGMKNQFDYLRSSWDAYKKELPEQIEKIAKWQAEVPSPESSRNIFKYLDGQVPSLEPAELKVANQIKNYLRGWADRLGLPADKRVSNYITHLFEPDFIQKEFPQELGKLIDDKVPSSIYDPFVQQRLGKQGYREDVWAALSAYVKRATRKSNLDPALKKISESSTFLDRYTLDYVTKYTARMNLRPTKLEEGVDNLVKSTVGYKYGQRPFNTLSQGWRKAVYRGALGLNPKSALRNLTQGANTYAKLGERYTAAGYWKMATDWASSLDELKKVGVLQDSFVSDQGLSVVKTKMEKLDDVLFAMFSKAEEINRGGAYFGAKAKALAEGMSETKAIEYAKKIVRETQFQFGAIDAPLVLSDDMMKTLGQFQSYNLKQLEFVSKLFTKKEWAGLLRYIGATIVLNEAYNEITGSVSPLSLSWFVPIGGGSSPAVSLGQGIMGKLTAGDDERKQDEANKKIWNTAKLMLPGGVQAFKTGEGIYTVAQGRSVTPAGNTRFTTTQTPGNFAKAALFGQYALEEGQDYIRGLGKSKAKVLLDKLEKMPSEERAAKLSALRRGDKELYNSVVKLKRMQESGLKPAEISMKNLTIKNMDRANAIAKRLKWIPANQQYAYIKKLQSFGIVTPEVYEQLKKLKKEGKF